MDQLEKMFKNLEAIFGRCPACVQKLKSYWCEMACSPDQSLFFENPTIGVGSYYISQDFSQGIFDSCRDVELEECYIKVSLKR